MTLLEAAERLLTRAPGRWVDRGYEKSQCSSCGALRLFDYDKGTEKREPCSKSCPWRQLEEAVTEAKNAETNNRT